MKITLMTPAELARYEDIVRRLVAREWVERDDFGWRMDNLTRYEVTVTATQTSPL